MAEAGAGAAPPLLVGGDSPHSMRLAAVLGDAWAPVVDDPAEFGPRLARFAAERESLGLPSAGVSVFVEALEPDHLAAYERLGVGRLVVNVPLDSGWQSRLERLAALP